MTAERVTVSLPPDLLADARRVVDDGQAASLSAFVADALHTQLTRARALADLETVLHGRPPQRVLDAVRRDLGLAPRSGAA